MKQRIYKDAEHQWRWSLVDKANGKVLADSGQGYSRKADCTDAMEKVSNMAALQMVKNDLQLLINTINRIQEGHKL